MRLCVEMARTLVVDETGQAVVEYAVLLALIFLVCLLMVGSLGNKTNQMYEKANSEPW